MGNQLETPETAGTRDHHKPEKGCGDRRVKHPTATPYIQNSRCRAALFHLEHLQLQRWNQIFCCQDKHGTEFE